MVQIVVCIQRTPSCDGHFSRLTIFPDRQHRALRGGRLDTSIEEPDRSILL